MARLPLEFPDIAVHASGRDVSNAYLRERALEFKASLKDVAPKVAAAPAAEPTPGEPATVEAPAKKKGKFTWEADDVIVPTAKTKKSKAKVAGPAMA